MQRELPAGVWVMIGQRIGATVTAEGHAAALVEGGAVVRSEWDVLTPKARGKPVSVLGGVSKWV
jgi:hypothetical protein